MKLAEQVRSTHNQDGAVVLDILHGEIYRLNVIGSHIFRCLQQGFTESQISQEISSLYNLEAGIAAVDVREFLSVLEQRDLVHKVHQA